MRRNKSGCPSDDDLIKILSENGGSDDLVAHVSECARCHDYVVGLRRLLRTAAEFETFRNPPTQLIPAHSGRSSPRATSGMDGALAGTAILRLAARTDHEIEHRMAEAENQRGIHCLFVDPSTGNGCIRPLFVKVVPSRAREPSIHGPTNCDRVMHAAVTRAVEAAFGVLRRLGFRDAEPDRHFVQWWIDGPGQYEGASVGLGAALAAVAAFAGIAVDRTAVVTGATHGEQVANVSGIREKWKAVLQREFTRLVLPTESLTALPSEAQLRIRPQPIPVATVEDAIVAVFGPALGLAPHRLAVSMQHVGATRKELKIDLELHIADGPADTPRVDVEPQRHCCVVGDHIRVRAQLNRECYLCLTNIDSQNNLSVLFPSKLPKQKRMSPRRWHSFPTRKGYAFPIEGPPGLERIIALASDVPFNLNPKQLASFARPKSLPQILARSELNFYVAQRLLDETVQSVEVERGGARKGTRALAPSFRSVDLPA